MLVREGQRTFVRIAGPRLASAWTPLPPNGSPVPLYARPALAVAISVAESSGRTPSAVRLEMTPRAVALASTPPSRASGDAGVLEVPPLPRDLVVDYLLSGPESVPMAGTARVSEFPRQVVLSSGVALRGRFLSGGDQRLPVSGVRIDATFLLAGGAHAFVRTGESAADGRFSVPGIANGPVDVLVRRTGYVPSRKRIEAGPDSMDLGDILLEKGTSLSVRAVDASGSPVPFPKVRLGKGPWIAGDEKGIVEIESAAPGTQPLEARAPSHLPAEVSLVVRPAQPPVEIRMVRGAAVRGRLRRADNGEPAGPGRVVLDWEDGATWTEEIDSTGRFDLSGLRAGTLTMEFRADGLAPLRLAPRVVARGETVEIGDVRLAPGLVVTGVVLGASSSQPVAGARVRVPRPTTRGLRLSVLRRDWVEAESDARGQFVLSGLSGGVVPVLVEASGFAPHLQSSVVLREDETNRTTDLGEIWLGEPKDLTVSCRPERRCGREAQLLLGGPENDWASVTAPLIAGIARLSGVPAGARSLRLTDRGAILLERTAEVASDAPSTELSITLPVARVDGEVTRGGRPVAGGDVLFRSLDSRDTQPAIYFERRTETTLQPTSEVIGVVPRTISAEVDALGRFSVPDALPGSYDLTFLSADGASSRPQNVVVPESGQVDVRVELPAADLFGSVDLEDGSHPAWASVEISSSNGKTSRAYAGSDGGFHATGLETGLVRVRASNSDSEGTTEVDLREGANDVRIVMEPKPSPRLEVRLLGPDGRTLENVLAFLLRGDAIEPGISDGDGVVRFRLDDPGTVQVASFHPTFGWAFHSPVTVSRGETELMTLSWPRAPATLEVTRPPGPLRFLSPEGFPVHRLFGLVGIRADGNLTVSGLPPGCYALFAGGTGRTACLAAGKSQNIRF